MKQTLSRRRCTLFVLLFLLADTLNTDLSTAGSMGWLLCGAAGLLAVPVYRGFAVFRSRTEGRLWASLLTDGLLLVFAFLVLDRMVRDFGGILRTYNDFALSPAAICLMLLGVAFYLSRLRGHGLARTAELIFWPSLAILLWTFCVGLRDSDFGRLLPLDADGSLHGLFYLLTRVFGQGILVQAVLEKDSEPAVRRTAMRYGSLLAGAVLGLFLAKDTAQVGWQVASRFTYPLYALAGLTRSGNGMHIEDLLICALLAARLIKGALIFKLIGDVLRRWRTEAFPKLGKPK